jgi:hypothetical protein
VAHRTEGLPLFLRRFLYSRFLPTFLFERLYLGEGKIVFIDRAVGLEGDPVLGMLVEMQRNEGPSKTVDSHSGTGSEKDK